MPSSSVAELQQKLFRRIGVESSGPKRKPGQGRGNYQPLSRKSQRKADRVQKKSQKYSRPVIRPESIQRKKPLLERTKGPEKTQSVPSHQKSLPRKVAESDSDEDEDGDVFGDDMDDDEDAEDSMDQDESDSVASEDGELDKGPSKGVRDRLAQDDAEIEDFERKLGLKKGRKSMPQSFKDDGLDDLLGELPESGSDDGDEGGRDDLKRKSEYDDWLESKRRKASAGQHSTTDNDENEDQDGMDSEDEEASGSEMDDWDDEMGSGSEEETPKMTPRQRENPYVAPTQGVVTAKYVPPSLRNKQGAQGEAQARLRKQVQGLINRLTDANILSIVQSAEQLYSDNARGDVTEVFTDAILAQVCKPETLPDQFFVLTGGFAAALYKLVGSSFGSHLIRRSIKVFSDEYEVARSASMEETQGPRRLASNILIFVSQLYVFEVVTCRLVFDYMNRLLEELSEFNVELLLRICRMAGRLLRRDDSQALKQVSSRLNKAVAEVGYDKVSTRTKFMIETIEDLKKSKPKAKGLDSAIVSEHVLRMRKRLGELKSQTRRLEGLTPMGMSLDDIESADTKGKWWLVGASVPVPAADAGRGRQANGSKGSNGVDMVSSDEEDMDMVLPDYPDKARAQGFNTPTQIAIFSALMSATNFEHAHRQFLNLRLKKDDQLEIANVLVQCVGSEVQYNEFYALVARQACTNSKVRFALQNRLWKAFRGMGESLFGEDADEDDTADGERMKEEGRSRNVARFYAALIVDGVLSVGILKPLNLREVKPSTGVLVEWLVIYLLKACRGKGEGEDVKVEKVFGSARASPGVAAGLHWFLRKKVRRSRLLSGKEQSRLERVNEKAQASVQASPVGEEK